MVGQVLEEIRAREHRRRLAGADDHDRGAGAGQVGEHVVHRVAGVDCGFATFAERPLLDARIAWAKLDAMVEGARLASRELG